MAHNAGFLAGPREMQAPPHAPTVPRVKLFDVTRANYRAVVELCVAPEQEHWVGTAAEAIAEVHFRPELKLLGVAVQQPHTERTAGRTDVVGLIVYGPRTKGEGLELERFLIDCKFQGRGYGRAALELFVQLAHIRPEDVEVHVSEDNDVARRLYASMRMRVVT